jgi:hypothetical protein
LLISIILNNISKRRNLDKIFKISCATNFVISTYIIGGSLLFPLFLAFKPVKINGISYLQGVSIPIYWILSWTITIFLCTVLSYFLFFRINKENINIKSALVIGFLQLPLGWFFEIVIYVYMRKTIPTIFDYFFGKNFPWLNINWVLGALAPIITVLLINKKRNSKKQQK